MMPAWAYDQEVIQGSEDDGEPFVARWMPLSDFGQDGPPLYPTGLLELLVDEPQDTGAMISGAQ